MNASVNKYIPNWDSEDVSIAIRAAQNMADNLNEPIVILFDLSVRRQSDAPSCYLERVTPKWS
jgi:hypothetical protein